MHRVVVTDLDGTIVRLDATVTPATVQAAAGLSARGVPLIAATARTPAGVAELGSLAPHLSVAVCCGGAVGWSPGSGEVLWRHSFSAETVDQFVRFVAEHLPLAGIAAYDGRRWAMTEVYAEVQGTTSPDRVAVVPAAEIAGEDICALAICHSSLSSDELMHLLSTAAVGPALSMAYSEANLVDIGPAGHDKATGVRRALDGLGLTAADAIAFGDMPNDLPMLRLCGHGVAVANAHPAVLAAAATVARCVDHDGFTAVLIDLGMIDEVALSDPSPKSRGVDCPCWRRSLAS